MPELELRLAALVQNLEDDSLLAEALLFPGVSCYGDDAARVREMLARAARGIVKRLGPGSLYRHRLGELPLGGAVEVEIPAIAQDVCRKQPVRLTFRYVQWRHGSDAAIAYVPALGIEVLAEDERQLQELLVPQIRSALSRRDAASSLRELVLLGRGRRLDVRPLPLGVKLPTLKEAAVKERKGERGEKSVFKEVATDLVRRPAGPIYEREEPLARLAQLLTGRIPRSVLLVGRSGTGKTALVYELARRRGDFALGVTPFWSTSGSRLIAGAAGYGMWQQRCQNLVREAGKTKAIVHLDNLVELVEVGKGGGSMQGMAAVLRPAIERGALLAVAECTPEQLAVLEREDPQLLEAFAQIDIAETTEPQTRSILAHVTAASCNGEDSIIAAEALATLDRLHRRWATYSASPGRPLRFLRNLLEDRTPGREIMCADVTAAFSHETGLPLFMLDDAMPLDLAETRAWFAQRVIGQPEPVELIVDLLAAVKAGLVRGGKPIASLLFIGPTGVGKTEMGKSLAEFLYQDPQRMIRFDMSEYSHPAAVERLIGGTCAAQGLLTQKVRDQPFMVVLLDEFEKAHPLLFDVLLQVLGEGRLTDGAGRVADFSNTVVIMTSNLGAESYRGSALGFAGPDDAGRGARQHFEREVKSFLRPEMFNRLDRIVPFAPLERATIAGIARREIQRIAGRDGLRLRGVKLDLDAAAIEHLAQGGFDVRYGARPLKRAIERQLVAPLAERLSRFPGDQAISVQVQLADGQLLVDAAAERRAARDGVGSAAGRPVVDVLDEVVRLRRKAQGLEQSSVVLRLKNEIYRLRQVERQRKRRRKKRGQEQRFTFTPEQARLLAQEELLGEVDGLAREIEALEDNSLGDFYAGNPLAAAQIDATRKELETMLREVLFRLHQFYGQHIKTLSIPIFSEHFDRAVELASAYESICRAHKATVRRYWLKMYRPDLDVDAGRSVAVSERSLRQGLMPCMHLKSRKEHEQDHSHKVVDAYYPRPEEFHSPPPDCIGVALQIVGERPAALLETEAGQHEFRPTKDRLEKCLVETVSGNLMQFEPPANVGRKNPAGDVRLRRTYDFQSELCTDCLTHSRYRLRARDIGEAVAEAVEEYLAQRTWSLIDAWN